MAAEKKRTVVGQVNIVRTDGLYFCGGGGTFEYEQIKGSFAPTMGGTAIVVYIDEDAGVQSREAYEVSVGDIIEVILRNREKGG